MDFYKFLVSGSERAGWFLAACLELGSLLCYKLYYQDRIELAQQFLEPAGTKIGHAVGNKNTNTEPPPRPKKLLL